ncbi:hypothetical protein KSP40_PGU005889 [Platanthera guangdongensis]|uniref:Uncharacterized protein n=1 Tax=Platanthera guangdongensis TaxID=2320717 RepID=A0ABR2MSQ9_9ASPA
MASDGMLELHWGGYYYAPPLNGTLDLQLMPSIGERGAKPFFSDEGSCGYLQLECRITERVTMTMRFARGNWYPNSRESRKILNCFLGERSTLEVSKRFYLKPLLLMLLWLVPAWISCGCCNR